MDDQMQTSTMGAQWEGIVVLAQLHDELVGDFDSTEIFQIHLYIFIAFQRYIWDYGPYIDQCVSGMFQPLRSIGLV